MATLEEILGALEADQIQEAPTEQPGFSFSDILSAGEGALDTILTGLDYPGRIVRNALAGNESLTDPFSGRDLLESYGILGENQEGIDAGDVLGFGAEIALDPLTFFGGAIGRFASKILKGFGGGTTKVLEGLGGIKGTGGGKLFEFGERLGDLSGLQATLGGAAIGGAADLAFGEDLDPTQGLLLGAGAGVGFKMGGQATARGAIAAGENLSRTFAERNAIGATNWRRAVQAGHRGDASKKVIAASRMRNVEAQIAEEARVAASKFVEQPFFGEVYAKERLGEAAFETRLAGLSGATDEGITTLAELPTLGADALQSRINKDQGLLRERLKGKSGKEVYDELASQIDNLSGPEDAILRSYYGGGGKDAILPGKFFQEQILEKRGIFTADIRDEFVQRTGLSHAPHVRNAQTADEALWMHINEMRKALGPRGEGLTGAQIMQEVRKAKGALSERLVLGDLEEIEKIMPGHFTQDLAKMGFEQNKRFVAFTRLDDALTETWKKAEDSGWIFRGQNVDHELVTAGVLKEVDLGAIPLSKHRDKIAEMAGGYVKTKTGRKLADKVYMRREIHDFLFNKGGFIDKTLGRNAASEFQSFWRKATNWWKGWTLAAFPSWWARNVMGNFALNHVSGVGVEHLGTYGQAIKLQKAIGKILRDEVPDAGKLVIRGKTYDLATMAREAIEDGIVGSGFVQTEIGEAFRAAGTGEKPGLLARLVDPQENYWTRMGFGINGAGEDWQRLTHYIAKRADGEAGRLQTYVLGGKAGKLSPDDARTNALESTKLNLYDIDELTDIERERFRDFIPFYSWIRANLAGSFRHLVTAPQRTAVIGRMKVNLDKELRADIPDDAIPQWIQGQLHVPVGRKNGRLQIFSLQNWLPLADLAQVESPEKFLQYIVNSAHPVLNEAVEQGFNFDTFFKRAIENVSGERTSFMGFDVTKRFEHLARNLRILNELDYALETFGFTSGRRQAMNEIEAMTPAELLGRGLGVKIRPVDLTKQRKIRLSQLAREISELESKQRRARREGDLANQENLAALIADRKQRRRFLAQWDPMSDPTYASLASPDVP